MDKNQVSDDDVRKLAYELWEEAGSPAGQDHDFWIRATELLKKQHVDIDEASEHSFPASDPVNHM